MADDEDENDAKVLAALQREMTNAEITAASGLKRADVGPALRQLRAAGAIVSRGRTNKRTHMKLATAVEKLFEEVAQHQILLNKLPPPKWGTE